MQVFGYILWAQKKLGGSEIRKNSLYRRDSLLTLLNYNTLCQVAIQKGKLVTSQESMVLKMNQIYNTSISV